MPKSNDDDSPDIEVDEREGKQNFVVEYDSKRHHLRSSISKVRHSLKLKSSEDENYEFDKHERTDKGIRAISRRRRSSTQSKQKVGKQTSNSKERKREDEHEDHVNSDDEKHGFKTRENIRGTDRDSVEGSNIQHSRYQKKHSKDESLNGSLFFSNENGKGKDDLENIVESSIKGNRTSHRRRRSRESLEGKAINSKGRGGGESKDDFKRTDDAYKYSSPEKIGRGTDRNSGERPSIQRHQRKSSKGESLKVPFPISENENEKDEFNKENRTGLRRRRSKEPKRKGSKETGGERKDDVRKPDDTQHSSNVREREKVGEGTNKGSMEKSTIQHSQYIRKTPNEKLFNRFKDRLRAPAEGMPEVHFIGDISGGLGFGNKAISCKWTIEWGKMWSFLEGEFFGQSQYSIGPEYDLAVWDHPIDIHFASASIQGWPRILLQVWGLDEFGRANLAGYGFLHLPSEAGNHSLTIACWRPSGTMREEIQTFFLGATPQLTDESILFGRAWESRCRLVTVPCGKVQINISVVHRHFSEQLVDGDR